MQVVEKKRIEKKRTREAGRECLFLLHPFSPRLSIEFLAVPKLEILIRHNETPLEYFVHTKFIWHFKDIIRERWKGPVHVLVVVLRLTTVSTLVLLDPFSSGSHRTCGVYTMESLLFDILCNVDNEIGMAVVRFAWLLFCMNLIIQIELD